MPTKPYWREEKIANKMQKWNYRSEYVGRLGLDRGHSRIWMSFGLITVIGFSAFVIVKTQVIQSRREEMLERERIRKEMLDRENNKSTF